MRVLGRDLIGMGDVGLTEMRRSIGFIFQLHNLLPALTTSENVQVPMLEAGRSGRERRARAAAR